MSSTLPAPRRRGRPATLTTAYPTTRRELDCAATALRDAARAFAHQPAVAAALYARAERIHDAGRIAENRRLATLQASGRWARKPYKCGPEQRPGIGHVTVFGHRWTVDEVDHLVMCGRVLHGRNVDFGAAARPQEPPPAGWTVCVDCKAALDALPAAQALAVAAVA